MKLCGKCQAEKPKSDFGLCSASKDKLQGWCKNCFAEWRRGEEPEKRQASQRRYYQSGKGKERRKKWKQSDKGRACKKRWRNSDKGKRSAREYHVRYGLSPENAIKIKSRKMARVLERQPCVKCGNPKSDGHHPDYSKPLEVVWLCTKHHAEEHTKLRNDLSDPVGDPADLLYDLWRDGQGSREAFDLGDTVYDADRDGE